MTLTTPRLNRMNWKMLATAVGLITAVCWMAPAMGQQRPTQRDPASRPTQPARPSAQPARPQDGRSAAQRARDARTPGVTPGVGDVRFDDLPIIEGENDRDPLHRRVAPPERTALAFHGAEVEQIIPFIAMMTGKPVIPVQMDTLRMTRIWLVNDELIPRMRALDLLFDACRLNGIGVVEREDVVILMPINEIPNLARIQVLPPQADVMRRADVGNTIIKVFPLHNASAELVGDRILEVMPNAALSIDANSNQLVVVGDVGLAQQIQLLVNQLDRNFIEEETRTFFLRHADAIEVMENILDLFPEQSQQVQRRATPRTQRPGQPATRPGAAGQQQPAPTIGPVVQLRVTPIPIQNAITITAKPDVVGQIADLIVNKWDLPRPYGTSKVYTLRYTDAVQMTEKLRSVLGQGSGAGAAPGGRTGGAAAGQRTDVGSVVSGIYSIEAYPEHNRIVVLSKTEESFDFLDHLISQLDQRSDVGLPLIIELKHADAVDLAEELNALLQEWGGGANIPAPARGLSGTSLGGGDGGDRGGGGAAAGPAGRAGGGGQQAGRINFPWQARQRTDRAFESPIIGQARIMPIVRQNALAVLAPPAHLATIQDLIEMLDRPGRQVLIAATVVEVRLEDSLSLGLRWGAPGSVPAGEGSIPAGADLNLQRNPAFGGNLFTSSILDVGVGVDVVLNALGRRGGFRILQSPRIFTSDNKEAQFFDGATVPFITSQQQSGFASDSPLINQFDREDVGVRLNVRPRITVHGDIDMELVLELSTVNQPEDPARIRIDRRETTTHVVVKDGQTIILSGILRDEESRVRRRVPILGDIPILGALFSSTDTSVNQTELIAFITPIIVENPSANDENYNVRERERLRELSRPLRHHPRELDRIRERISDPGDTGRPVPERSVRPEEEENPNRPENPTPPRLHWAPGNQNNSTAAFDSQDLLDD